MFSVTVYSSNANAAILIGWVVVDELVCVRLSATPHSWRTIACSPDSTSQGAIRSAAQHGNSNCRRSPSSPLWSLCSAITSPFRQSMPPPPLQPKFGAGPPPIPPRPHNMGTQQGGEPKRPYAPVYIPGTLTSWLIPNFELRVEDVSHPGAQLFFDSVRPADALKDAVISTCSWLYTLRDVPTK